jgi:hypothetical protein
MTSRWSNDHSWLRLGEKGGGKLCFQLAKHKSYRASLRAELQSGFALSTELPVARCKLSQNARPGSTSTFGLAGSVVFDTTTDGSSLISTS